MWHGVMTIVGLLAGLVPNSQGTIPQELTAKQILLKELEVRGTLRDAAANVVVTRATQRRAIGPIVKLTHYFQSTRRWRLEYHWQENGLKLSHVLVQDGDRGWNEFNGLTRDFSTTDWEETRNREEYSQSAQDKWLTESPGLTKFTLCPSEAVGQEDCFVILVERAPNLAMTFFITKKGYELRRTLSKRKASLGAELQLVDVEQLFTNYKRFDYGSPTRPTSGSWPRSRPSSRTWSSSSASTRG